MALRSAEEMPWWCDIAWKSLRSMVHNQFASSAGVVDMLELCGGLGTGQLAMQLLIGSNRCRCVGYWDTDERLVSFLRPPIYNPAVVHCGKVAGDILKVLPEQFPLADFIVAGNPCLPWSKKGKMRGWDDDRSSPMIRTLDTIIHQAQHGHLKCFVLENVRGWIQKQADGSVPAQMVIDLLKQSLANARNAWTFSLEELNSKDFCLPQNRPRVYLIGRIHVPDAPMCMRPIGRFECIVPVGAFLDLDRNVDEFGFQGNGYTSLQQANLLEFKAILHDVAIDPNRRGSFAFFEYGRTVSARTKWKPHIGINCSECLTAHGPCLHVLSLGNALAPDGQPLFSLDRSVLVSERFALQGFPKRLLAGSKDFISDKVAVHAVGNAMSLPVVAAVIGRELLALQSALVHGGGNERQIASNLLDRFHYKTCRSGWMYMWSYRSASISYEATEYCVINRFIACGSWANISIMHINLRGIRLKWL